jgi:hypothetical protein
MEGYSCHMDGKEILDIRPGKVEEVYWPST